MKTTNQHLALANYDSFNDIIVDFEFSIIKLILIMKEVEALYKNGTLKIVNPSKIQFDKVTVKILNRDEILTEEDMKDIIKAKSQREKEHYYTKKEAFK